jgi:hypothetical protein
MFMHARREIPFACLVQMTIFGACSMDTRGIQVRRGLCRRGAKCWPAALKVVVSSERKHHV